MISRTAFAASLGQNDFSPAVGRDTQAVSKLTRRDLFPGGPDLSLYTLVGGTGIFQVGDEIGAEYDLPEARLRGIKIDPGQVTVIEVIIGTQKMMYIGTAPVKSLP